MEYSVIHVIICTIIVEYNLAHCFFSLKDLDLFIKDRKSGLSKTVEEGDYEGLVEVMGHLMKVKDRQAATDTMFGPLKETIEFLKEYGEELPDEVHTQLQAKRLSTHSFLSSVIYSFSCLLVALLN